MTAMPSIVSQMAGLQSLQSPVTAAAYLAPSHAGIQLRRDALLDRRDRAERLAQVAACQPGERRRVDEVIGLLAGAQLVHLVLHAEVRDQRQRVLERPRLRLAEGGAGGGRAQSLAGRGAGHARRDAGPAGEVD